MNFLAFIFQDWKANKGNGKGRAYMCLFRIANFCARRKIYYYLGAPYLLIYKVLVQWIFTLEIPWNTRIGKNLSFHHGMAIVMNNKVVIGDNCLIRHCTTIGIKQLADGSFSGAPVIGNHVDIGNNVCIIGDIRIGDHVKIGSGSVVVKTISENSVVAGNPATEKRKINVT